MAGLAVNSETLRQQFAGRQAFGDSGQVKEQTEGAKETKERVSSRRRPNWLEKGASEETTGP